MSRPERATTVGNLPAEVTSFVGRRRLLTEVKTAFGKARLVTLVGPGGVGKTRIGLRAATELQRGARAGLEITQQNQDALVEICRHLDGMPLALELAAVRLRTLGVDQLLARLTDRFALLTGGSRAALPRQQTLRATIDWSYDLLTEPERRMLQRLSVFAGDFGLEAVEAV